MKRKIIAGKEFCTYVRTPLIADDVHAYNVIWDTGVTDKNAGMVITAKRNDGVTVTDYSVTDKQGRGEYTLAGNMYSVTGPLEIRLSLVWETTTLTEKVLIFEVIEGSGNEKIESEDNVPILNTILAKATEAVEKTSNIPTKLSRFENDGNFVQDEKYVHTDNNYTAEEKEKLRNIEQNAQVNVIEKVKVNGKELPAEEKTIDVTVPTKLSQLENDENFSQATSGHAEIFTAEGFIAAFNDGTLDDEVGKMIIIDDYPSMPAFYIASVESEFDSTYKLPTGQRGILALVQSFESGEPLGKYKFKPLKASPNDDCYTELLRLYKKGVVELKVSFDDYMALTSMINGWGTYVDGNGEEICTIDIGQRVTIRNMDLPDLIVCDVLDVNDTVECTLETNEEFLAELQRNGVVKVGSYTFKQAWVEVEQMNEAITASRPNDYELIKTIEITEDIPTVDEDGAKIPITFNLDDNGNTFKLDAFVIIIWCTETPSYESFWRADANKYPNPIFYKKPTGGKAFKLHSERLFKNQWLTIGGSKFYQSTSGMPLEYTYALEVDYITSLYFEIPQAPIGTKITVYGRRVKE